MRYLLRYLSFTCMHIIIRHSSSPQHPHHIISPSKHKHTRDTQEKERDWGKVVVSVGQQLSRYHLLYLSLR